MANSLILTDYQGQTLARHVLDDLAPLRIRAVDYVYYQLADAQGFAVSAVQAGRAGQDLQVTIDGHLALEIEDYFVLDSSGLQNPLVGLQANGQYVAYQLAEVSSVAAAPHVLAQEMAVNTGVATAQAPSAAVWAGVLGMTALGAALISRDDDDDNAVLLPDQPQTPWQPSSDATSPPIPAPTPAPSPIPTPTPSPVPTPVPTPTLPVLTLAGPDAVQEGGSATYTLSLDQASTQTVSVNVRIEHLSTDSADLVASVQRITLPAGETSIRFAIHAVADSRTEGAESYRVVIESPLNATLGSNSITTMLADTSLNPAPLNQSANISISGQAEVGQTLLASVQDGNGVPSTVQYQWFVDNQPIAQATGASYTLLPTDAGKHVSVQARYTDNDGFSEAPRSASMGPVTTGNITPPVNHAPTGAVTISGWAEAGKTLVAGNSLQDADGLGYVQYQWFADNQAVGSGATYTLRNEDAGKAILLRASYTDGGGTAEYKDSLAISAAHGSATSPYSDTYGQTPFDWAGMRWVARDSDWKPGGPQVNEQWARANIALQGTDMILSLSNPAGNNPTGAEVIAVDASGYGSYQATFSADFAAFDAYAVFGFFTFEWHTPSIPGYRELDAIEISRWGESELKGLTTYYPTDTAIKVRPSYSWPDNLQTATVRMDWQPEKITWSIYDAENGHMVHSVSSTENIPVPARQQVHLNLWTYEASGWENVRAQNVTLQSFSFVPLTAGNASPPTASISGDTHITEGGSARYTISLDKAASVPVIVTLSLVHDNSSAADFATAATHSITFQPGQQSLTLTLDTVDDALPENAESYTLSLQHADNAELGTQISVRTTIADNDEIAANHQGSITDSTFAGDRAADIPYFIAALDAGNIAYGHLRGYTPGQALTITYQFADNAFEAETGQTMSGFRAFSEAQKADIRGVFAHLQEHSGLIFQEGTNATLNLYLDDLGEPADSNTVGYGRYGGNVHLNSNHYAADDAFARDKHYRFDNDELILYSGWSTMLHEIGHSLGLDHPFEGTYRLSDAENRDDLTIMSYTAGETIRVDIPGSNRYYPAVPVMPNRLGIYDLAALHYRYGVNPDQNSGNDTYTFRAFDRDADGNGIYIADGGGLDIFDASEQTLDLTLNLTPGSWIHAGDKSATLALDANGNPESGQMFIGYGSQIESAKGGSGNDRITGNGAGNYLFGFDGDDHLDGGHGHDQLEGGRGADQVQGGAGRDTFIFASPFDGTIDTLLDFNMGEGDMLQLGSAVFTALDKGALAADAFVKGRTALDGNDRLLYDQGSGELAYDPDGNGSAAAVTFARLANLAELDYQHIQIV